jgi:glycogen debranching enzyme
MNIIHKLPGLSISKEDHHTSLCILSNNLGGFLFLSQLPISKFNGLFVNYDLELFKTIENIGILGKDFTGIENHLTHIKRNYGDNSDKIVCPKKINGTIYSLSKKDRVFIDFDCRKVNDIRTFGRTYDVTIEDNKIIVEFTKKSDEREDNTESVQEFSFYAAVQPSSFKPETDYEFVNQWVESYYRYDHERKDFPAHRYVHRPFIIDTKELLIGVGRTKKEALDELDKLKHYKHKDHHHKKISKEKDTEAAAAFICAQDSLEKLKVEHEGVTRLYAGYPWFFQIWSRDENISLGALIKLHQFKVVKDIIFKYLQNIGKDGRLPNHIPSPHLGSADGAGWFWKRVRDFISELKAKHSLEKFLSKKELEQVKDTLAESIRRIEKKYGSKGLITNKDDETWMDTDPGGQDPRDGARIEIQALHLNMLRLMHDLSGERKYKTKEEKMKKEVATRFWNGDLLADGLGDFTVRPNIFIAYYVYPDLLSEEEWKTCFNNEIKELWLDWGGLTSIDTHHPLFVNEYTGIDDRSYHRGDSWFWINNLAALCMFKIDPIEFEEKILRIIESSSKEILWKGAVGHHAEVSSAARLSSKGCVAQAWSAAMFIELIMEVYK